MAYYREYTNVTDLRSSYLGISATTDDVFILDMIRQASDWIDKVAHRSFVPLIATDVYDRPEDIQIDLHRELLSLTSLVNGDGSTIAASNYIYLPANSFPKTAIKLREPVQIVWQPNSNASYEQIIQVIGVFGHTGHKWQSYTDSWLDTVAVLAAAITSTTATTFTCTTGKLRAGWLIQIDSEWMYVSSVSTGASDTVTVVRGINGSTAATHLISTAISYWNPSSGIQHVAKVGAAKLIALRDNPSKDTLTVDGVTFNVNVDVDKEIQRMLDSLSLIKRW